MLSCQHPSKGFGATPGAHWQNIHRATEQRKKKKQFITVILACRHSAPRTGDPKQKADFFLGSLLVFKFLRAAWKARLVFAGENLSRRLSLRHAAGSCGAVQLSGSSAGVEGSTSSESSPQTNAESFLNSNHMRRLKIQGPLFTLWPSPTADKKKTTKN